MCADTADEKKEGDHVLGDSGHEATSRNCNEQRLYVILALMARLPSGRNAGIFFVSIRGPLCCVPHRLRSKLSVALRLARSANPDDQRTTAFVRG